MSAKVWLVLIVLLTGCSSMQIGSDYATDVDFGALRSYDWLPAPEIESGKPAVQYDSLLGQRLTAAVDEQLTGKGLQRQGDAPDVLVTYHVAIDQKVSVIYLNELYGYGPGWGPAYRRRMLHEGYPGRDALVSEYRQGTLIVDLVRASDKKLIWRGTATDEVYPDSSMEAREKRVREAVVKIFEQFPPPSK